MKISRKYQAESSSSNITSRDSINNPHISHQKQISTQKVIHTKTQIIRLLMKVTAAPTTNTRGRISKLIRHSPIGEEARAATKLEAIATTAAMDIEDQMETALTTTPTITIENSGQLKLRDAEVCLDRYY